MTAPLLKALEEGLDITVAAHVVAAKLTGSGLQKARMEISGDILKEICSKAENLVKERLIRAT